MEIQPQVEIVSEKITVTNFEDFSKKLQEHMVVDSMMIPVEGNDYQNDILAWIKPEFVQYVPGESEIELKQTLNDGSEITVNTKDTALPEFLIDGKGNESLLYGAAVTMAKLRSIREIASDVYPTLEREIDSYLDNLTKMSDEILKISEKTKSENRKPNLDLQVMWFRKLVLLASLMSVAASSPAYAKGQSSECERVMGSVGPFTLQETVMLASGHEGEFKPGDLGYVYRINLEPVPAEEILSLGGDVDDWLERNGKGKTAEIAGLYSVKLPSGETVYYCINTQK